MERKSVASNYSYNLIYQIILSLIPLATTPYLTRVLGAENLGIYSYIYSIVTIFFLLSALGINTYGQREIAYVQDDKEKRSKVFWELIVIRVISTLLSTALLILLSLMVDEHKIYFYIFAIYVVANMFDITWFYQGIENFKAITVRNIIVKIIYLITVFSFVRSKSDLWIYIFLYSIMTLTTNLSFWLGLKTRLIKPEKLDIKKHIKPAIMFFLPQIASLIYTVLDKTMLGIICPDIREVSYYEQASYLVKTVLMLVTTISTVMVSKVSYAFHNNNQKEIRGYLKGVTNFVWIAGSAVTFGLMAIVGNFVPWFYAQEYISMINIVYVMGPIIIIIGLNNVMGIQFLVPTQNQNKYIFAVVIGAITNFFLNLLLIKPLGAIGATIASVIAELTILIIELFFLKKNISDYHIMENSLKYILYGIAMFLITKASGKVFGATFYGTIFQVLIGVMTYGLLLVITKDQYVMQYLYEFRREDR